MFLYSFDCRSEESFDKMRPQYQIYQSLHNKLRKHIKYEEKIQRNNRNKNDIIIIEEKQIYLTDC